MARIDPLSRAELTEHEAGFAAVEAAMGFVPKVAAVWEFETSDQFDEAERAALRLAFHAGQVPNAVTDADFEEAARHFGDQVLSPNGRTAGKHAVG